MTAMTASCKTCGLDNDGKAHDALEIIGHLRHPYDPIVPLHPTYVYVASSWRNPSQPVVVDVLRANAIDLYSMSSRMLCAARPAARRGWPAWLMFVVAFVVWVVVLGALRPVSWALIQLFGLAS